MATDPNAQLQTMIDNMPEKTGKSLEEWFTVLAGSGESMHGNMLKLLKGEYGVTQGEPTTDRLEDGKVLSGMCSHRVRLSSVDDVDEQVIEWLRAAYQRA